MPKPRKTDPKKTATGAAKTDFKQTLWAAADKMRKHTDAAEYKHIVLGLIFLKYISDRDHPLPRPMSGEIRIKDAERMVGDVA
ncbi:type I restriction-modification system subunit M N-terminal domain-containing protein [Azospirillum cavernae]|uniref:type I restriction-modification system subunit M N-terminal domain-containing protein n=1 Tax=Azospirillum cavernae TaxID=2320860 RepID=UPI0018F2A5CB|nr:type I restriction-modification system subunit M N-terminal domain-containing protein [Azospirillum cavernae]